MNKPYKFKKPKISSGFLTSHSKPFSVSSESFQYEHGSQFGSNNGKTHVKQDISRVKKASVGTNLKNRDSAMSYDQYTSSTISYNPYGKFSAGKGMYAVLTDAQFRLLYGHKEENESDLGSSIDPGILDGVDHTQAAGINRGLEGNSGSKPITNAVAYSNPPVLVANGTLVRHYAPNATNIHMIHTEGDYAKICREEQLRRSQSSGLQYYEDEPSLGYRIIRPKVSGAPVSVMVEQNF